LSRTSTASVSDDSPLRWRVRFNALDLALYRRVRSLARTPQTVKWVRRYSRLGEHGAVWLATGATAALVDRESRRHWLRATAAVGLAYATSTSIKLAVGRKRPAIEDLPHLMATPTGLSFPSSHSTSSFAAARAFGALIPGAPLQVAALAMGLSRLYLGVHYPSDVVAGAALGTLIGSLGR
jgi:undecaprenyl-diphosphatase